LNTESGHDWITRQWSVPINLMFSHIVKIGRLPFSMQAGPRYYCRDAGRRIALGHALQRDAAVPRRLAQLHVLSARCGAGAK
jgi:hypothetical protein